MKFVIGAFMSLLTCWVNGQAELRFHSQNYIGIVQGTELPSVQVQTINGFQKNKWFAGVGAALDYYFFRSVPLFISVTRYASQKPRTFFVSGEGGTNFIWDGNTGNKFNGYRSTGDFHPGWYFGGSAGYKLGLKNKDAVLLNIGYSAKYLKETILTTAPCLVPPCPEFNDTYDYHLKRLSLKVGWMF
jgi:hypothetical protein